MLTNKPKGLTKIARFFLEPKDSTHRQYEALRAYFVEGLSSAEAALKFGYSTGSFRVLCSQFRKNPDRQGQLRKAVKDGRVVGKYCIYLTFQYKSFRLVHNQTEHVLPAHPSSAQCTHLQDQKMLVMERVQREAGPR